MASVKANAIISKIGRGGRERVPISIAENRDCMAAMKEFPDKFFDLAVVDPPYGDGRSQSVNVERERESRISGTASEKDLTDTNTAPKSYVNRGGVARETEIPPRYTSSGRTAGSQTEHGVMRTGGTWATKYTKKLFRGMLRRDRIILRSCSASHAIR